MLMTTTLCMHKLENTHGAGKTCIIACCCTSLATSGMQGNIDECYNSVTLLQLICTSSSAHLSSTSQHAGCIYCILGGSCLDCSTQKDEYTVCLTSRKVPVCMHQVQKQNYISLERGCASELHFTVLGRATQANIVMKLVQTAYCDLPCFCHFHLIMHHLCSMQM